MTLEKYTSDKIHFQFYDPFVNPEFVEELWLEMTAKCQHSFFVSWGWISTWIKSLPTDSDVRLVVGLSEEKPVIAFFAGRKQSAFFGFLPSRTISLNSTPDSRFDRLHLEYNSILFDPAIGFKFDDVLTYLDTVGWDEFVLSGAASGFVSQLGLDNYKGRTDLYFIVDKEANSHFVNLQKIRSAGMDYFQLLSANKRSQIRRSIKEYEKGGDVTICQAGNVEEGLSMFENLVALHQDEWIKRGRPGAFANRYFYDFHKALVRDRFESNEIQLLHILNGDETIGYLYNFVYNGDVLFYQSGFNYPPGNVYRPGLVSHYLAVVHNARDGFSTYDFLAGDSAYKTSLSTGATSMARIRFMRSPKRFYVERQILELRRRLVSVPQFEERLKKIYYWLGFFRG